MPFTPREIINGKLMRQFNGKIVSVMVKIESRDANGQTLHGTTTDNVNIRINLSECLNQPIENWVEIIGIPTGPDAIRCKEIILFDHQSDAEPFDADSHNMLIQFLQNCPNPFELNSTNGMESAF